VARADTLFRCPVHWTVLPVCSSLWRGRRPCSTLFPYTTLFRSLKNSTGFGVIPFPGVRRKNRTGFDRLRRKSAAQIVPSHDFDRSEEHTSELQSRENLVCRLLLEKKNAGWRMCGPATRG